MKEMECCDETKISVGLTKESPCEEEDECKMVKRVRGEEKKVRKKKRKTGGLETKRAGMMD